MKKIYLLFTAFKLSNIWPRRSKMRREGGKERSDRKRKRDRGWKETWWEQICWGFISEWRNRGTEMYFLSVLINNPVSPLIVLLSSFCQSLLPCSFSFWPVRVKSNMLNTNKRWVGNLYSLSLHPYLNYFLFLFNVLLSWKLSLSFYSSWVAISTVLLW